MLSKQQYKHQGQKQQQKQHQQQQKQHQRQQQQQQQRNKTTSKYLGCDLNVISLVIRLRLPTGTGTELGNKKDENNEKKFVFFCMSFTLFHGYFEGFLKL